MVKLAYQPYNHCRLYALNKNLNLIDFNLMIGPFPYLEGVKELNNMIFPVLPHPCGT